LLLVGCGGPVSAAAEVPTRDRAPVAPTVVASPGAEPTAQREAEPEPAVPVAPTRAVVYLAPLGEFDDDLLDAVETGVAQQLQVEVRRLESRPLPKHAWYPPRRRWRADEIIDWLPGEVPDAPEGARVLALTSKDISTTKDQFKDWGVFGLGDMPGPAAVVSSFRLRRGAKDREHLRRRVTITAIHEIGHTLGLPHCTEHAERCPMQDAEGSITNTDTSTGHLGPGCRADLERKMPIGG
jgi:archaemetzincin